jgi:anti-anti-sigma factor
VADLRPALLDVERLDDVVVVRLVGEHDLASAPSLGETLTALANEGLGVAVDVSAVEFLDLAVVRALLAADRLLRERHRRLAIQFGTAFPVRRLLQLTEVEELFACADDRATAIELARRSSAEGEPAK